MDAIELLKSRRSVRHYKDETISRDVMSEVIDIARFAPSWANFQIARYTFIDDVEKIKQIELDGVKGFVYNINTLKNAKNVVVLSFVKGKSGKLDPTKEEYATTLENYWESFDAGIACQTFCLAAHAKGIGTCIMGVIDSDSLSKLANLPAEETVAALIVCGYPESQPAETPRKNVEEILRFAD